MAKNNVQSVSYLPCTQVIGGFCMTLWPIIIHHHSKPGYKRLSNLGDIVRIKSRHMDAVIPIYPPNFVTRGV